MLFMPHIIKNSSDGNLKKLAHLSFFNINIKACRNTQPSHHGSNPKHVTPTMNKGNVMFTFVCETVYIPFI